MKKQISSYYFFAQNSSLAFLFRANATVLTVTPMASLDLGWDDHTGLISYYSPCHTGDKSLLFLEHRCGQRHCPTPCSAGVLLSDTHLARSPTYFRSFLQCFFGRPCLLIAFKHSASPLLAFTCLLTYLQIIYHFLKYSLFFLVSHTKLRIFVPFVHSCIPKT